MALSLATNHGSRRGCALSACDVFVATGEARKQEATDASEPLKNVMVLLRIWCGGDGGRGYRSYIRRIRSSGEKVNIKRLYRSPPLDRRFVYDLQEGGGKKTRKKQEEFMMALLLHLEAIPAMTEGKKRKKKKNETVADWRGKASRFVGIVQPLYLSRGPGFPRVHRVAAGKSCKKKIKILRAQKDEDVVKSFASKHSGLDRQHFPLRRNVGKLGVVALTGKY